MKIRIALGAYGRAAALFINDKRRGHCPGSGGGYDAGADARCRRFLYRTGSYPA